MYGLLAVDWVQTGLITHDAFTTFVYHYWDPSQFQSMGNQWLSLIILSSLVSLLVQWFFAWRIYVLSPGARVIAAVIALVRETRCFMISVQCIPSLRDL